MLLKCKFNYLTDYEQNAIKEIAVSLIANDFNVKGQVRCTNSRRACLNQYGKTLPEDEFEELLSSGEVDDDYYYSLEATVDVPNGEFHIKDLKKVTGYESFEVIGTEKIMYSAVSSMVYFLLKESAGLEDFCEAVNEELYMFLKALHGNLDMVKKDEIICNNIKTELDEGVYLDFVTKEEFSSRLAITIQGITEEEDDSVYNDVVDFFMSFLK